MPQQILRGRVGVVTGGANGIGRATALVLAAQGARIIVADLKPTDDNKAVFDPLGIQQHTCDVRRVDQLEQLMDRVATDHGRLDILVNNAGVGMEKPVLEVGEEDWDSCLDTNLKAAFFASKFAIRHMTRQDQGGSIVNNSSNAGLLPRIADPVYSISKQALIGLTRSLALCHADDRIRVNAVCPGPVGDTAQMNAQLERAEDPASARQSFIDASPLARAYNRMIRPDEVAQAILYLVSDAAIMVSGTALAIDGAKSLGVPRAR